MKIQTFTEKTLCEVCAAETITPTEHAALYDVAEAAAALVNTFRIKPRQSLEDLQAQACSPGFGRRSDEAIIEHWPMPSPFRNNAYALLESLKVIQSRLAALEKAIEGKRQ